MARNKYPEVTVEKILEAAQRLFLEKGYDNTTIQDIVNELGGLTKGAVYHHFKSKEDIMDALGDKLFLEKNPFDEVRRRTDLNGLEKMRAVIFLDQQDETRARLNRQAMPILKNPRILAQMIETNQRLQTPYWRELLEEGNRDGSLHTAYAAEIAEVLPLLSNVWLAPTVYPATAAQMERKFIFLAELLDKMGVPLIDDRLMALARRYFQGMAGEQAGTAEGCP